MQKNNQIGFLVNETVSSQKSFNLIKNINEYIEENGNKEDFVVFFENSTSSVLNPKFALMSFNEIWSRVEEKDYQEAPNNWVPKDDRWRINGKE